MSVYRVNPRHMSEYVVLNRLLLFDNVFDAFFNVDRSYLPS